MTTPFESQAWPSTPAIPTGAPAGYTAPTTPPNPSTTPPPLTSQQVAAYRQQFYDLIIRQIVLVLVGFIVPNQTAQQQLADWAVGVADEIAAATAGLAAVPAEVVSINSTFWNDVIAVAESSVPVLDETALVVGGFLGGILENAIGALAATGILGSQVASVQNQVSTPSALPMPHSIHGGEVTTFWDTCDTDITITPTSAVGGLFLIADPMEKFTAKLHVFKASSVTAVYLDAVKYDVTSGVLTRMYQSGNEVTNVTTGTTPATDYRVLTHTNAADAGLTVNTGEFWGWVVSCVGGNLTVRGRTDPNPASPVRPYRRGFAHTITSGSRMPATVTQSTMDGDFSAVIPYIEFGGQPGVLLPLDFFDNFARDLL